MPKIFYSSVIPASIDPIWAIIRDFKELPSWNPSFSEKLSYQRGSRIPRTDRFAFWRQYSP